MAAYDYKQKFSALPAWPSWMFSRLNLALWSNILEDPRSTGYLYNLQVTCTL